VSVKKEHRQNKGLSTYVVYGFNKGQH